MQHRRAAVAHRRDRGAAPVAPERGVRRLRARAARRSDQPGRAGAPRAAGRRDRALGQAGDAARRARSRRSTKRAAPSICCCGSRASTRRRPASSKRRSPPTGAPSTADPDNKQALVALDRLYARAQQWDELADIVRREIRIAPTDEDRVALNFRLAQIYELALVDMPKAVEAYRDILTADPTHAETRAALERMFLGGTMQLEIADVLEPLYRVGRGVGEAAPDSRGAARAPDRRRASGRRCCAAWPRSPSTSWSIRSRRSAGGPRRSRRIRRRSRRSTSCCAWRARPTSGTRTSPRWSRRDVARRTRRPSGATCCCGSPPASRTTSATSNARRARSSRC